MSGDNQDDLHFQEEQISDFPPSNALSTNVTHPSRTVCLLGYVGALCTNEDSRPSNEGASSSVSAKRSDQEVKTDDIPVGVVNDVCQGKSDTTSSLKPTIGMSKDDPYIYKGGIAPKVPFIVISPDVEEIQDEAFRENEVIERLVLPKKVTSMGKNALYKCSKLKYVIFEEGSSLRHIGYAAFFECRMIEEMNLPASLETLGANAFYCCEGLWKVTLSPKMTAIEWQTFTWCFALTVVEGMNAIQSIGWWSFGYCLSLDTIDVNQSADIDDTAFNTCNARINRI